MTLNDFVDHEIAPPERAQIERHLAECDSCRTLVAGLEGVKGAAAALGSLPPPARVWAGIDKARRAERLDPWRFKSASWPLATAAVLLLAAVVGVRFGSFADFEQASSSTASGAVTGEDAQSPALSGVELQRAESDYQVAIDDLERVERSAGDGLDPQTADALQNNLAVIDAAIGESRAALAAEPQSSVAQHSLLEGLKTKVALLQTTAGFVNAHGRNQG